MSNYLKESGWWIETYTQKRFNPFLDGAVDQIDIVDIGHALANTCRFSGHCNRFYSVAQHSVLVSEFCDPENKLWGLLHDASEAYLGDIPSPIKRGLTDYQEMEKRVQKLIAEKFELVWPIPPQVKEIDLRALRTESIDLMNVSEHWEVASLEPLVDGIIPYLPARAEEMFLHQYTMLLGP